MPDYSRVKLGKKAARIDKRTLRLGRYFLSTLAPPPDNLDNTSGITNWGMMLNDELGDCTMAGAAHGIQVWSAAAGLEVTLSNDVVEQMYTKFCGYDPSQGAPGTSNPTDQGGVELDILNQWRQQGFAGIPLSMYADPNPTNLDHVKKAIELFGFLYIGVQLPNTVQGQSVWDVVLNAGSDGVPGSWGGHCVIVPKYRTVNGKLILTCISWGEEIDITQDFWLYNDPNSGSYVDETHALVSTEYLNASGQTPMGLDLTTMENDAQQVTA